VISRMRNDDLHSSGTLEPNISKTPRDREPVTMEHLQEILHWVSNGHMPPKGKGRDSDTFGAEYLENAWRQRLGCNGGPIGDRIWGIKSSRVR